MYVFGLGEHICQICQIVRSLVWLKQKVTSCMNRHTWQLMWLHVYDIMLCVFLMYFQQFSLHSDGYPCFSPTALCSSVLYWAVLPLVIPDLTLMSVHPHDVRHSGT